MNSGQWVIEIATTIPLVDGVRKNDGTLRWYLASNWDLEEINVTQRHASIETHQPMKCTTLEHAVDWVKRLHEQEEIEMGHFRVRNVITGEIIHGVVL